MKVNAHGESFMRTQAIDANLFALKAVAQASRQKAAAPDENLTENVLDLVAEAEKRNQTPQPDADVAFRHISLAYDVTISKQGNDLAVEAAQKPDVAEKAESKVAAESLKDAEKPTEARPEK